MDLFGNRARNKQQPVPQLISDFDPDAIASMALAFPGTGSYAPAHTPDGEEVTCFVVKEDSQHVSRISAKTRVSFRCFLKKTQGVGVLVVLLRIKRELYETWWNWCNPVTARCWHNLSKQDQLYIAFLVNSAEPEKVISVPNVLRADWERFIEELRAMEPWDMLSFDLARQVLSSRYPSPLVMWESGQYDLGLS